ncbi:hypothetical protein DMENIID0001_114930 [Sergentomyia squamirostris]
MSEDHFKNIKKTNITTIEIKGMTLAEFVAKHSSGKSSKRSKPLNSDDKPQISTVGGPNSATSASTGSGEASAKS